jgi:hypothetical protein
MTSNEVIKQLEQAQTATQSAVNALNNLIVPHDYQDVAGLVAQASLQLLQATHALMQSDDTRAFAAIEQADELLDGAFAIIDSELEDDEE